MATSYTPGDSASPTHLETITAPMTGRMYSSPPVISNTIATSETVMRVTPPSTAAAPTIAYTPGVTHCDATKHCAKIPPSPLAVARRWTHSPSARPRSPPVASDGMSRPPGTGCRGRGAVLPPVQGSTLDDLTWLRN